MIIKIKQRYNCQVYQTYSERKSFLFIFYSTDVYEETTLEATETPKTNRTEAFGEAKDLTTTETTLEEEMARSLDTNEISETTPNTIEYQYQGLLASITKSHVTMCLQ